MKYRGHTVYRFRKKKNAQKKQSQIKRMYGFKPGIYKVTNPKTKKYFYTVTKAKGIQIT